MYTPLYWLPHKLPHQIYSLCFIPWFTCKFVSKGIHPSLKHSGEQDAHEFLTHLIGWLLQMMPGKYRWNQRHLGKHQEVKVQTEVFHKDQSWVHFLWHCEWSACEDRSMLTQPLCRWHCSISLQQGRCWAEGYSGVSPWSGVASWVNNGLKMNVDKTQVMFLGRRSKRKY